MIWISRIRSIWSYIWSSKYNHSQHLSPAIHNGLTFCTDSTFWDANKSCDILPRFQRSRYYAGIAREIFAERTYKKQFRIVRCACLRAVQWCSYKVSITLVAYTSRSPHMILHLGLHGERTLKQGVVMIYLFLYNIQNYVFLNRGVQQMNRTGKHFFIIHHTKLTLLLTLTA